MGRKPPSDLSAPRSPLSGWTIAGVIVVAILVLGILAFVGFLVYGYFELTHGLSNIA